MLKRFWFMATPVYALDTRQGAKLTMLASTPTPAHVGFSSGSKHIQFIQSPISEHIRDQVQRDSLLRGLNEERDAPYYICD